jgi:hypothetical protein
MLIHRQGIAGHAAAQPGANLDSTEGLSKEEHPKVSISGPTGYESVNLVQKLVFFGVIIGVISMIVRLRGKSSAAALNEKYPA